MEIIRKLSDIRKLENPVVTIGNFDGVHMGHRQIFRMLKEAAAEIGGVSVVITFDPHPLKVLRSAKKLRLINTPEEKEQLIEASGIDYLIVIPFTDEFAALTATEFVRDILVEIVGIKKLVIGYDYAFGRNREGNIGLLRLLGDEYGFSVDVLEPIWDGKTIFSSTNIRKMIVDGKIREVVASLGRHFSLEGKVVHGHHRGKVLGFPTANVETDKELIPKNGVYAVKVRIAQELYDGACNIGPNPTFGDEAIAIEVFIFEFAGDLYGEELRVYFIDRIRDERKFPDAAALQMAIASDVAKCREILRDASIIEYHEYLGKD
ncbi:MAG TPA: bifunctional riboflavin kinase/FAD synthetase [Geobacteraceae bacterium]|nr:bifunctional riboflavin kinase/FAD synthetase [Geobacteraceae bacterium]